MEEPLIKVSKEEAEFSSLKEGMTSDLTEIGLKALNLAYKWASDLRNKEMEDLVKGT